MNHLKITLCCIVASLVVIGADSILDGYRIRQNTKRIDNNNRLIYNLYRSSTEAVIYSNDLSKQERKELKAYFASQATNMLPYEITNSMNPEDWKHWQFRGQTNTP